jgi:hypothetical protein
MFQYKHNHLTHAEKTTKNIHESGNLLTTQKVKILFFGHNSDLMQLATAQSIIFSTIWTPVQQCVLHIYPPPPPKTKRRIPLNNISS